MKKYALILLGAFLMPLSTFAQFHIGIINRFMGTSYLNPDTEVYTLPLYQTLVELTLGTDTYFGYSAFRFSTPMNFSPMELQEDYPLLQTMNNMKIGFSIGGGWGLKFNDKSSFKMISAITFDFSIYNTQLPVSKNIKHGFMSTGVEIMTRYERKLSSFTSLVIGADIGYAMTWNKKNNKFSSLSIAHMLNYGGVIGIKF